MLTCRKFVSLVLNSTTKIIYIYIYCPCYRYFLFFAMPPVFPVPRSCSNAHTHVFFPTHARRQTCPQPFVGAAKKGTPYFAWPKFLFPTRSRPQLVQFPPPLASTWSTRFLRLFCFLSCPRLPACLLDALGKNSLPISLMCSCALG